MPELSGAEILAQQLATEDIDTVFAVYAGPMTQALGAIARQGIRIIGCRHEEQAGFMAQAWGYINRRPGLVIVGSGPAMTNTVTSLYAAQENGWPLVVLGGSAGASTRWTGPTRGFGGFQETDQVAFAAPACKWSVEVDTAARIPEFLHLGFGKAVAGRPGAVYIDFPGHILAEQVPADSVQWRERQRGVFRPFPDPTAIEAVAAMLAGAQQPLVLIGKGAAWADAGESLQRLVDLGIPFLPSPMGRGTVPDDHPHNVAAARSAALAAADSILMVGGRFNWIFQFGRPPTFRPDVRIAQIDVIAEEMSSAADVEIGIISDCATGVEALTEALEGRPLVSAGTGWLATLSATCAKNRAALEERLASDAVPISPYRLFREIRDCVPRETTLAVDGEITLGLGRLILPSFLPRHRLNSGTTACMGTGVPYAIAAKLARPNQASVAVLGDYAFGASATEIETAARVGAHVVFVVVNNGGISGRTSQRNTFRPEDPLISGLLQADYEKMAEMVNGFAARVDQPEAIKPALEAALQSDRVSLVNVLVDPEGGVRRGGGYL